MSSLFGTKPTQANNQPGVSGLNVQTSAYGKPVIMLFGANRLPPNLMWYGNFNSTAHNATGSGKGGTFGGASGGSGISYTYSVSLALALCEGPIAGVGALYLNKDVRTLASEGFNLFLGPYPQTPWAYLTSNFPASAFGFNGIAYVAAADYHLGSSTNLPNHNFEVFGKHYQTVSPTIPDADPSLVVNTLLKDAHCGVTGFTQPVDFSDYQKYAFAAGLFISPMYDSQTAANTMLQDIATMTNSEFVDRSGTLTLVPYGDLQITGNGKTWTPPAPDYDLTDDDFLPSNGGSGSSSASSPILISRKRASDALNRIVLECLDRNQQYAKVPVEAKNQAAIDQYGLRDKGSVQAHMLADTAIGALSAQLQLQREAVANQYTFTTDFRYCLVEVMDLLTLTHANQGLDHVIVRVKDITENSDDTFTFQCEEVLDGIGTPALYSFQQAQGFASNFNVDPGNCQTPFIFEPTDAYGQGLVVALATAGGADWGGCEVWVSTDQATYNKAGPDKFGPSRYGALTAPLASVVTAASGQTIDAVNTLSVDISASLTQLLSGSQSDAIALNTLCYVDGEYLAYKTATLTGTGLYDLTYLVRGVLGTTIGAHGINTTFARLDSSIYQIPFRQDQIGQTIYIKLLAFNKFGAGRQTLAEVSPFAYKITGLALTTPLPDVQNVRTVFNDGFTEIWWDENTPYYRSGTRYKIFKGPTFIGSQQVGDNAHAPFKAFGDDTYWIVAYYQPLAGLIVTSLNPASITIAGNMLVANLVHQSDQQAAGWPGIFSNGTGIDGPNIRLGGSGNILTDPDFLNTPDIANYGGVIASGTYEIAAADWVDLGYVGNAYVSATWKASGAPIGQNVLGIADFLNAPDILGSASTQFIKAKVQIAIAQSVGIDLFSVPDVFNLATPGNDAFAAGIIWSAWQDYAPGVYKGRLFKFRLVLGTLDANTTAIIQAFTYAVSVQPRIDHYQKVTVPAGGLTINFLPDNSAIATPQPFNGGPPLGPSNNNPLPYIEITWPGPSAAVDFVIDTLTLAAVTFHFIDVSGVPVVTDIPGVNVYAEGF